MRLERCQIVRAYPEIAADVKRLVLGSYLLELVDTLTAEKETHPEIFDLLQFFIGLLIGKGFREELLRLFELRLFCYLGYQPQFQQCMLCRGQFNLQEATSFPYIAAASSARAARGRCPNCCRCQTAPSGFFSMPRVLISHSSRGFIFRRSPTMRAGAFSAGFSSFTSATGPARLKYWGSFLKYIYALQEDFL